MRTRPIRGVLWRASNVHQRFFEIHFEPRAEIHWTRDGRDTDIAQITGRIARRDVQTPAESNRQMLKIPADAYAFIENFKRGSGGARMP